MNNSLSINRKSTTLEKVCENFKLSYTPVGNSQRYIGLEHINSGELFVKKWGNEDKIKSSKFIFKTGDILYGKLRPYLDKCVLAEFDGICSTELLVLQSKSTTLNKFILLLLHTNDFIKHAINTTSGVNHPRTSWASLKKYEFDLPNLDEQLSIVKIMFAIQSAISAQEALLTKLQELKSNLMQHLFTHGTRGEKTKMTEIGEIPESWDIQELNKLCDLLNGYAFKSSDYIEKSNTINVRMSNIKPNGLFDIEYNKRYLPDSFATKYSNFLLNDGDVLIAMTDMANDPKILGIPTIVKNSNRRSLLLNQRVGKLISINTHKVNLSYLKLALSRTIVTSFYKSIAKKGVQINIGKNDILRAPVILPPLVEQKNIAIVLDKLDNKIENVKNKNSVLHSLFKTLLHELMSGERRVV